MNDQQTKLLIICGTILLLGFCICDTIKLKIQPCTVRTSSINHVENFGFDCDGGKVEVDQVNGLVICRCEEKK